MTIIRNDRDILLRAAAKRVELVQSNSIIPIVSAPRFTVLNGVAAPATITVSASFTGLLQGVPTYSVVSGISRVHTTVPGQCVLWYSDLTEDTCVIRISLNYLGVTYTTDVSVEGKSVPPAAVGAITTTPEIGRLRLSWPKNIESDIGGYEVRLSDSGWGDGNFLFHGNSTNCLVDVAPLLTSRTWFVRAFDSAGLYSTTSRQVSFTVQRPTAIGTLTSEIANTSITTSTALVTWAPVTAPFGLRHYSVSVSPTGIAQYTRIVSNPSVLIDANWIGNCTVTVVVVDILGNESLPSTPLIISKLLPVAPSTVTATPSGTSLLIDWLDVARTTLPVAGYELRRNNASWGTQDANFMWRGNASEVLVPNVTVGLNTFFLNTYDTDGRYASTPRTVTYSVLRPPAPSGLQVKWNDTSTTSGTATFTWSPGADHTFAPARYRAIVTKPERASEQAILDNTNWTVEADWVSTAEIRVWTIDVLGQESEQFASLHVNKVAPQPPTAPVFSVVGTNVLLRWTPAVRTTLPVYGYEVRNNSGGWGSVDAGLEWRGTATSCNIAALGRSLGVNSFFIRTYDTDSVYSTGSAQVDVTIAPPAAVGAISLTYTNSTATGVSALARWAQPASMFALAHYLITISRAGFPNIVVRSLTTEHQFLVDWAGDATVTVVAVDVLGHSSTVSTATLPKIAPSTPGTVVVTEKSTAIELNWADNTRTSLPIAGYELRSSDVGWGTGGHIWRGISSIVELTNITAGIQSWFLRAFDTAGQYSTTSRTIQYTPSVSGPPQNISGSFSTQLTTSSAIFRWQRPTSTLDIIRYNVTLSTTNPLRTLTGVRNTTDWEVPADWLGAATLTIQAVSTFGHEGSSAQFVLTKELPSVPPVFLAPSIVGSTIELDWNDSTRTSLPVLGYEIRSTDSGWGTQGFVWKGSTSSCSIDLKGVPAGTTVTWFMRAFDTDNRYSTASRSVSYTILAPVNPLQVSHRFEDTNLTSASVILTWSNTSPIFGLQHYSITGAIATDITTTSGSNILQVSNTKGIFVGDSVSAPSRIPAGSVVTAILNSSQIALNDGAGVTAGTVTATFSNTRFSNSTTITLPADWLGDKVFSVRTVDLLGNMSSGLSSTATKVAPSSIVDFRAQVIDNTVLLFWTLPNVTTLPIAHARIKKGSTWNTAETIGNKDGSFSTVTELRAGNYTYWIAAVDTDNNESTPVSISAVVSQPPDYVFNTEWESQFTGTRVNAIADEAGLILPVNTTESFEQHFLGSSWTTPNAQVAAGFPIYIQPGLASGQYEEIFDYGTILGSSQITISINGTNVVGAPLVVISISTSLDGVTYTPPQSGAGNVFATNFRYIRVTVSVTQNVAGALYRINRMVVRLDAKQRTDAGSSVMEIGGAHPHNNIGVDYYSTWVPGMQMPPAGFILHSGSESEVFISLGTGPGGGLEPIWSCVDVDVTGGRDGGWGSTLLRPINSNLGHLYAVFIQTTSHNGVSYWGPSELTNNILTIPGGIDNNPYFWFGDLPTLNVWHLAIGYVHGSGYGDTVTTNSGIFNMAGTKLVNGTDFKFAPGTPTTGHRVFQWSNLSGSGLVTQRMARPIIVPCTQAEIPGTIQYLLTCATQLGATVEPVTKFTDIISINATPQGMQLRTPIVDFQDIPNPRRFNIFNFNSSGAHSDGVVSWTVRGY